MPRWKPLPEGADPSVRQLVGQLRRLKDRSGLSMAALEARTGCSRSSWERYLGGRALPSRRAVEELCRLSGTDPVRLLALREVAETVWDPPAVSAASGASTASDVSRGSAASAVAEVSAVGSAASVEDGTAPAAGGGERAEHRGVRRTVFALVVTAACAGAAVAGALLGLQPWQRTGPVASSAPVRCDVRSEEGALYAGHSRTWKVTIALGYAGETVAEAECLLSHHGYVTGRIDGLYDVATRDAARRAQQDAGLVADGMIGQHTWPVLRREG
ncbi:peptidoglycan hydrolase-like protein with peptidoglycan-binding domain [Streptomyces calvus]|uniref:helix-turn-helix domain-containing protein n=1 Tax=Streptomyces calvus TaxID=67282 RepID=UPI003515382B